MGLCPLAAQDTADQEASYARGLALYQQHCSSCHQEDGSGVPFLRMYPPLAQSDYLLADPDRSLRIIREGLQGEITVNGKTYDKVMAPIELSPQEAADVMNYVLHSWDNQGPWYDAAQVEAVWEADR